MPENGPKKMPLGRTLAHPPTYDARVLFPIPRQKSRSQIGIDNQKLPFSGEDLWYAHELSWLDPHGKPCFMAARLLMPVETPAMVESKSLKLYLNSFNMTRFDNAALVQKTISDDVSRVVGGKIEVQLLKGIEAEKKSIAEPAGICLDDIDAKGFAYEIEAGFLKSGLEKVEETIFSRLFRASCPVTGQPDWACVTVSYKGAQIDKAGLLRYLVSFREHSGFHEACVERIFTDLMSRCAPDQLTVSARFTRRGGIAIHPTRTSIK